MSEVIDVKGSHPVVQSTSRTPPPEPTLEQTPPIEKSYVPAGKHDTPAVSAGARKRLAYDSSSSEEEEGADDHDHHTMDANAKKLKLANTSIRLQECCANHLLFNRIPLMQLFSLCMQVCLVCLI